MNRYLYKRAVAEQQNYPNAQAAILDHIEMAITHAYTNFEGEDVKALISKLELCCLDIQIAQNPVKTKKAQGLGAIRDYLILEEDLPGMLGNLPKTKEQEKEPETAGTYHKEIPFPKDVEDVLEDIGSLLIRDMKVNVRIINALTKAGITTLRELAGISIQEFKAYKNIGFDSVAEIIKYLKENHGIEMAIDPVAKETKKRLSSLERKRLEEG